MTLDGAERFFTHVRLHDGPAPVRRCLPNLIELVFDGTIDPGKVFDLTLPLERAMDCLTETYQLPFKAIIKP